MAEMPTPGEDAMDFELDEEYRMLKETVARFVDQELMPLEREVLAREARGEGLTLTDAEEAPLLEKCRELGLWGLDAPEEFGGANLPSVAMAGVFEELGRTITPFVFPPDSPNLHMLDATAVGEQRERYLGPYSRGEAVSAIAISEPGAGADPSGMKTRARKEGGEGVLNGRKIWISRAAEAAFTIVMAVTDPEKGRNGGMSAFIVEAGTPGFVVEREIPMIGGGKTYEVILDDCRIPERQLLGELGQGFAPMQLRLNARRLEMGSSCLGIARRALGMMREHALERETFGVKLADRQAIQWWLADSATNMKALKLMVLDASARRDAGEDVRTECSQIKYFATETAERVVDQAQQTFGAMGVTKELPLHVMAARLRTMRVYEGPTEVHRWVVARRVLRDGYGL